MRVAIHPDDYTDPRLGKPDASSPRWAAALEAAGHEVVFVDVRDPDILKLLAGCDGFMWRFGHSGWMPQRARRLLPVVEQALGLCVYPDQATCWHFDDKLAQAELFRALGIPTPRTWAFFDEDQALAWLADAPLPLVLKLDAGAGSQNVRRVETRDEAAAWVRELFGHGVRGLGGARPGPAGAAERLRDAARSLVRGRPRHHGASERRLHHDYVLFQEFLPGNDFDTRVTVIGHRAFAYRRFNRPGDFRASGSGRFDPDPAGVDPAFVRLAFEAARRLGSQSLACDGLWAGARPVIAEVSYAYVSWMVHDCPGHWEQQGDEIVWVEGAMWPEDAQVADFVARLESRAASSCRDSPHTKRGFSST